MDAIVVYESVFGNTRAIAEGLASVPVLPVHEAAKRPGSVDLPVVGGPTHMHGMSTARSRRIAAEGVHEDGAGHVEPGATGEPGLRSWLRELPPTAAQHVAAFDTELERARAWGRELALSLAATDGSPVEASL